MLSFVGMIELLPKTLTAQYAGFFLYDGTSGSESFIAHKNILSDISFASALSQILPSIFLKSIISFFDI